MKKNSKNAFTLIELLAVIIILGVLLIIAIPSVTKYIQDSRRESYVTIVKEYITGASSIVNSSKIQLYDLKATYYIPTTCINLESGGESPFGDFEPAYVVVTYSGNNYDYYFTGRDTSSMGVYLTYEKLLSKKHVVSGVKSINTSIGIGNRDKIIKYTNTCLDSDAIESYATTSIPEKSENTKVIGIKLYNMLVAQNKENGEMVLDNKSSTYVEANTGINFDEAPSNTNGKGIYVRSGTENDLYPIYYYRGEVANNNVIFGNFCWKIVRTTETGGIKLVYNGIPRDGMCNNTGSSSQIGTSKFNQNSTSNTYVGYMYGLTNGETYEKEHENTNNSTIKEYIDKWYSENMTNYTEYLEDTVWCNDRSLFSGTGIAKVITYYNTNERNYNSSNPSLECTNQNDRFTVNETLDGRINGNGALTYPVALLTADELTLAGQGYNGYSATNYLHTGLNWWGMSPGYFGYSGAYVFLVSSNVRLNTLYVDALLGVRPALSLKRFTEISEDGDGSVNNPFVVQ